MILLKSVAELRNWRLKQSSGVGFVPTMGALHEGHWTLLRKARSENSAVVLSIFVNPTQFNNKEDFEKYPITLDGDLARAKQEQVDAVFLPQSAELYPDEYHFKVTEDLFSKELCGAHRPGHFDGVLSVVLKLLNLVQPARAYFGEKDYQQLRLIQGMVQAFFLPIEIVPVPTVREESGLALSSRNLRLNSEQIRKAPQIYHVITRASSAEDAKKSLIDQGFVVDYVEDIGDRRYVAATLGSVRLIDNVKI
jgi:pantoate--beta-alanine ligase